VILTLAPGGDIATLVRDAAADGAESIVVVIAPGADPLAAAVSRAAVGPLAVEHAPGVRINAVAPGATTAPDVVASAVAFLDSARSTTGQILELR